MGKRYKMNEQTKKIEEVVAAIPEVAKIITDNDEPVYDPQLCLTPEFKNKMELEMERSAPGGTYENATELNPRCTQDNQVQRKHPIERVLVFKDKDEWTYFSNGEIVALFYVPYGRWTKEP